MTTNLETRATDIIAGLAPWLAPIPTAYLVGRASLEILGWPLPVAIVAAVIIEALGLAATSTALTLFDYNQGRRKNDSPAPFTLAAVIVGVYITVAICLTVLLDIMPGLSRIAPAIFPLLSLAGVTVLALRADHRRRLEAIRMDKLERKASRQLAKGEPSPMGTNRGKLDELLNKANLTRLERQEARKAALLDVYRDAPELGPTDAARRVGLARQTVYNYLDELEKAGEIRRNGHGVEVLK